MKQKWIMLLAAACCLALLAGCGSASETAAASASESTSSVESQEAQSSELQDFGALVEQSQSVCLFPEDSPWLGAWYDEGNASIMVFEGNYSSGIYDYKTEILGDEYVTTEIEMQDYSTTAVYHTSLDGSVMTMRDTNDQTVLASYRRPTLDDVTATLPAEYWGYYSVVSGTDSYSLWGELTVDAFRFGNLPYEQLTDNGDNTYTFLSPLPPDYVQTTIELGTYEDAPAIAVLDDSGNATVIYQKTS